jgi:cytochrome c556
MKRNCNVAGVLCMLLVFVGAAEGAPKPDDAVHYRQGILMGLGWNIGPMGAMVQGKVPFDKERFAFLAARAAQLAPMVAEGFDVTTKDAKSEALPKLWNNLPDFQKRMRDLTSSSQKLASVAGEGDEAAIRRQFGVTVKMCKGCHDEYRAKHED